MTKDQSDAIKGLTLATEFMKITHGFREESSRENPLPEEITEYLANARLKEISEGEGIDGELLVWGLLKIVELLMLSNDVPAKYLFDSLDEMIRINKENLND